MIKKGIILAGGKGTRMSPLTKAVNKQLLPIYDKPLIFYPLVTLMELQIKDIAIIVKSSEQKRFFSLLGNGQKFGIKITYLIQDNANGLAEAFIIAEHFIGTSNVTLILGDNIFYGLDFSKLVFPVPSLHFSKLLSLFSQSIIMFLEKFPFKISFICLLNNGVIIFLSSFESL